MTTEASQGTYTVISITVKIPSTKMLYGVHIGWSHDFKIPQSV
jgi:hypothetical protein